MWDVIVVGGGISGLAAAYQIQQGSRGSSRPFSCCVVESSDHVGGKVRSESGEGFLVEGGPDAFVTHKPWALELVRELGLESRLLPSREEQKGLYILSGGQLQAMPEGLRSLVPTRLFPFLRSPLLSWPSKLRMLLEPLIRPGDLAADLSLGEFLRRRLGTEALEKLAEPLLAHIHMAEIERMSLSATYPQLRAMVERHGSLRGGMTAAGGGQRGGPALWSLREGMAELTDALAERLPRDSFFLGRRAIRLAEIDSEAAGGAPRYALELEGGTTLTAAAVILALPAFAAARLLRPWAGALADDLETIRYVSLATLNLGFRRRDLELPKGFGFFVPRREAKTILAATFASNKYEHRAEENTVLVRLFLGGPNGEEMIALPEEELRSRAEGELTAILATEARPIFQRLHRWPKGYPQYDVGHPQRVDKIETAAPRGLFLCGSAYHGVGLPDCIASGRQVADKALDLLASG